MRQLPRDGRLLEGQDVRFTTRLVRMGGNDLVVRNVAAGRTVTLELALRPAAAQKRYPRPGGASPGVAPEE